MSELADGSARISEVHARLDAVRSLLERKGLKAALLTARRNIAWLTAGASGHVLQSTEAAVVGILVQPDSAVAITANIEAGRLADEELRGLPVEIVAVPWWEPDGIELEASRRAGGRQIVRDDDLEAEIVPVRSVLSTFDQARLRSVAAMARAVTDASLASLDRGMTEEDLATAVLGRVVGARVPVLLVAADERIPAYRHPLPGRTEVRTRVMLVLVIERWGLHVAVTRFREFEEPSPHFARRASAVTKIQAAMHSATRPGATFGDVFDAARDAYANLGFPDEWREHHQGGSIGYQGRERFATPDDREVIRSGMAFAWNPSIAGAKAEDTVLLGDDGVEVLTAGEDSFTAFSDA